MKRKTLRKRWVLTSIPVVFLLLISAVFWIFKSSSDTETYYAKIDKKLLNPPNARLEDLNWDKGVFRVFYIDDAVNLPEGKYKFFSQLSNGQDKKVVYEGNPVSDFFVIDPQKKLLLITSEQILLMNEDGTNQEVIYPEENSTTLRNYNILKFRLSPDKQKLVFAKQPHSYRGADGKISIPNEFYIVDLISKDIRKFDAKKDLLGAILVDEMIWLKNNNEILFRATSYISNRPTFTQVIVYNLKNNSFNKVGEFNHPAVSHEEAKKPLSNFIDTNELFKPDLNQYDEYAHPWTVIGVSLDKTKSANFNDGNLLVNNNEIMLWKEYNSLYNPGCRVPSWLPDNEHIVVYGCPDGVRIIETSTRKVAVFSNGKNPKWFGRSTEDYKREDWK